MFQPFTQHPRAVGESYPQHFMQAAMFGVRMIAAGLACVVHAALPFVFQHTGSDAIYKLNQAMQQRRLASAASENPLSDKPAFTGASTTSSVG